MKTPEEFLTRGTGRFINCTDYDDAIKAMKEYAEQEVAKVISSNPLVMLSLPSDTEIYNHSEDEEHKQKLNSSERVTWRIGAKWMRGEIERRNVLCLP